MDNLILLGIDGGASKVLINRVILHTDPIRFSAVKPRIEVSYSSSEYFKSGFKPVALKTQLKERNDDALNQTPGEKNQELAIIDTFQRAIKAILPPNCNQKQILIGIGLPGLKPVTKGALTPWPMVPECRNF